MKARSGSLVFKPSFWSQIAVIVLQSCQLAREKSVQSITQIRTTRVVLALQRANWHYRAGGKAWHSWRREILALQPSI